MCQTDLHAADVTDVLWAEVDAGSNLDVCKPVLVPVADAVDAIRDGAQVMAVFCAAPRSLPEHAFEVVEHSNGSKTIGLIRSSSTDASVRPDLLRDMAILDG